MCVFGWTHIFFFNPFLTMSRFTRHIARQLMGYTLGSQAKSFNPLVLAKVDDRFGWASWYLTEYDPQSRIARAYVKSHAMQ